MGLPVDLAEYDIQGSDDRTDVRQHVPSRHHIRCLQEGEPGRSDLAAIGAVRTIRYQINPELTLRTFRYGIGCARRHMIALSIKLEVMDERFHRPFHLSARGRRKLVVLNLDRPGL